LATPSPSDPRYHLESQIRECYGRCAYTHKIHEKMAERLAKKQWLGKWANIILSALITGGAVTTLFKADTGLLQYADYATALLSILSLIFNAYLKDLDPGALAQRHRESASDMWNVRESYQSLIADSLDTEITIQSLRDRRDSLQAALHKLYLAAPFTDDKAYAKAKTALKDNEDLMFSEKEIDDMLPHTIRRANRKAAQS
jgi:hypothetical protein